jgi:hypothetical protein
MPYIRTTVMISATYHIDVERGQTIDEAVRKREENFREHLDENIKLLLAMAKGGGTGTVSWTCKLTKQPSFDNPPSPEMPPSPKGTTTPVEKDPRVQAELDALAQGRPPNGGLE